MSVWLPPAPEDIKDTINVNIKTEFTSKSSLNDSGPGIIHTVSKKDFSLTFAQLLFERGPISLHMYQPRVNNRSIEYGAYVSDKPEKNIRALVKVLVRKLGTESIGAVDFAMSMYTITQETDPAENLIPIQTLGEVNATKTKAVPSIMEGWKAKSTSYQELSQLASIFDFKFTSPDNDETFKTGEFLVSAMSALASEIGKDLQLNTADKFRAFVDKYSLAPKLSLDQMAITNLTDDDVPYAVQRLGFALRRKTTVRLALFDGQHRATLFAMLLNGIFDMKNSMELEKYKFCDDMKKLFPDDPDSDTEESDDALEPESKAVEAETEKIRWNNMSIHTERCNVIFGVAGMKDGSGTETLVLSHDSLSHYRAFGINVNSSQVKAVESPIYKQPINEAVRVLLEREDFEISPSDLTRKNASEYWSKVSVDRDSCWKLVDSCWEEYNCYNSLVFGKDTLTANQKKTIRNGLKTILTNPTILSSKTIACGKGGQNAEIFMLLAMCYANHTALRQLRKIFIAASPEFPQFRSNTSPALFHGGFWIKSVFAKNLARVHNSLGIRILFEHLLNSGLKQIRKEGTTMPALFTDVNEWIPQEIGELNGLSPDLSVLEECFPGDSLYTSAERKVELKARINNNYKAFHQDALIARMIMCYFFSDMVDALHHYGPDFDYKVVGPASNDEEDDKVADPTSNEDGKVADPASNKEKNDFTYYLARGRNDLYTMTDDWQKAHSFESAVYLWSCWLGRKLDPMGKPRMFMIFDRIGLFNGGMEPHQWKFTKNEHKFTKVNEDIPGAFRDLSFSAFLKCLLQPKGYEKFKNEGFGYGAENDLTRGASGAHRAHSASFSSVGYSGVSATLADGAPTGTAENDGTPPESIENPPEPPTKPITKPAKKHPKKRNAKDDLVEASSAHDLTEKQEKKAKEDIAKSTSKELSGLYFGSDTIMPQASIMSSVDFLFKNNFIQKIELAKNAVEKVNLLEAHANANNKVSNVPPELKNFLIKSEKTKFVSDELVFCEFDIVEDTFGSPKKARTRKKRKVSETDGEVLDFENNDDGDDDDDPPTGDSGATGRNNTSNNNQEPGNNQDGPSESDEKTNDTTDNDGKEEFDTTEECDGKSTDFPLVSAETQNGKGSFGRGTPQSFIEFAEKLVISEVEDQPFDTVF